MASVASTGHPADPGLRTLLGDVVDHVRALLRLELALARDEVRRALESLRHGVILLAGAVLVGSLGLLSLMAALVAALATVWPVWLAAGAVGTVFAVAGGLLARAAVSGLTLQGVRPSATIETLEETKAWLKSRT
jgi:Putative Actinobacterial Holin-X, holin superfamily III